MRQTADIKSFICKNCGHSANTFPQIEVSKIQHLPPVKSIKKINYLDTDKTIKYDPVTIIMSVLIGIILISFGIYLLYENLMFISTLYASFSIIGGIVVIITIIRHQKKHGIKK
jgi:hypothetical protein